MADEHEHSTTSFLESVMEKVEHMADKFHHDASSDSDKEKHEKKLHKVEEEHHAPQPEVQAPVPVPVPVPVHVPAPAPTPAPAPVAAVPVQAKVEETLHSVRANVKRLFGREKPVHSVLGGGKAADVMLWKNKQVSGGVLLGATLIWILFEIWGYHLLSLVCHALILGITGLFVWSNASTCLHKQPAHFRRIEVSDDVIRAFASAIRHDINKIFAALHDVASGRDLKKFLMVIAGLWILSVVGSWANFLSLLYFAFVVAHTLPVVYEKYQDQIDACAFRGLEEGKKYYRMFDAQVLSKIPKGPLKEKKF